jgi:hypothetical protein
VDVDAAHAINTNDLFWSGYFGPNWELWNETNDAGGFLFSPNRGTNQFWTPSDTNNPYSGDHGQWEYAQNSLDGLMLTNGSWIGYSVASAADIFTNDSDPNTIAFNFDKHAPPSPDGTYVAYIANTNDFATQIINTTNIYTIAPYNTPVAILGRPTLKFIDHFAPHQANPIHRSKIVEPPYWTDPSSNNIITEINAGGEITVNMGRKVYDDPNNPYGIDLIVYGNSFMSASGYVGSEVTDFTDENTVLIPGGSTGIFGHPTIVSISQDGTNWFTYPSTPTIFPDSSYRWDGTNHSWTDELANETKPLNPTTGFPGGTTVSSALDRFVGAFGGTGYDLKESGFPWIQFVRVQAGTSLTDTNAFDYTVIDAIAAANPVVVGDALSITPGNLTAGITDLNFQNPDDLTQTLISLHVDSVDALAKFSTITLVEFSSFAPVPGNVSSAYQITLKPITNAAVNCQANVTLRVGDSYTGNGHDLRAYEWTGTNFAPQTFTYDAVNREVSLNGVTNFSAFVISQIVPPQLMAQPQLRGFGFAFQFVPVPNCFTILERSTDLHSWVTVNTMTATNSQPATLWDFTPPHDKAFYRLRVQMP